jgi:hypothetical protein
LNRWLRSCGGLIPNIRSSTAFLNNLGNVCNGRGQGSNRDIAPRRRIIIIIIIIRRRRRRRRRKQFIF